MEEEPRREGSWKRPDLGEISRHYGGGDVYGRRRLIAAVAVIAVLLLLFLVFVGC